MQTRGALTPSVSGKRSLGSFQIVPCQAQSVYLRVFGAIAPSVLSHKYRTVSPGT